MENRKAISNLLNAYMNRQISRAQFDKLFAELARLEDETFKEAVYEVLENQPDTVDTDFIHQRVAQLYPQLQSKIQQDGAHTAPEPASKPKRGRLIWWGVSTAAAMLVFLVIGRYLFDKNEIPVDLPDLRAEQILPGGNRATLTLTDGRVVDLSTEQNGIIVGDDITYADGSLVLSREVSRPKTNTPESHRNTRSASGGTQYAILTTPKGGQYQLTLPDGTNVWLNANSTLKYPSRFTGDERIVELEGEAYFEVQSLKYGTHHKSSRASGNQIPFSVKTKNQTVEVLGTQFNINAYDNEKVTKTTLLSGTVRVSRSGQDPSNEKSRTLMPNQQSVVGVHGDEISIHDIDARTAIAWKEGLFNFHSLSIDESLKQIERWYDVNVVYEGKKPTGHLGGKMSRGVKLSTFLAFLEKNFQINAELKPDRTLILRAPK